jgi:hypothetical protein
VIDTPTPTAPNTQVTMSAHRHYGSNSELPSSATIGIGGNELSMSVHNASGRFKESWPHRQTTEKQKNWIVTQVRRAIDTLHKDSTFFEQNPPRGLPTFQDSELHIGQVIGNGEFGVVLEVNGFDLPAGFPAREPAFRARRSEAFTDGAGQVEFPTSLNNEEMRAYMSENALREGVSRFAVKVGLAEFPCCFVLRIDETADSAD